MSTTLTQEGEIGYIPDTRYPRPIRGREEPEKTKESKRPSQLIEEVLGKGGVPGQIVRGMRKIGL